MLSTHMARNGSLSLIGMLAQEASTASATVSSI